MPIKIVAIKPRENSHYFMDILMKSEVKSTQSFKTNKKKVEEEVHVHLNQDLPIIERDFWFPPLGTAATTGADGSVHTEQPCM